MTRPATLVIRTPEQREYVALRLLLALAEALRNAPPATIDDLLALLSDEDGDDGG